MSSSGGRPPRRMLPSVTDVVNELARAVQADPAVLFKVSRQVVAEELGRVKQGFESASIEVLARRARRLLDPATAGESSSPSPVQSSLFGAFEPPSKPAAPESVAPVPPAAPAPPAKPAAPAAPPPMAVAPATSPDEPFAVSTEVDLGWEKELPIQPDDAPFRSAILPIPRSRMPAGIAPPDAVESSASPSAALRRADSAVPVTETAPPFSQLSASGPAAASAPPTLELEEESLPARPTAPAPRPPPVAPIASSVTSTQPPAPKPDPASFLRSPTPVVPSAPAPLRSEERPTFTRSDTRPAFEPPPAADKRQPIRPPEDAAFRGPGRISSREWKALGDVGVTERLPDRAPPPASAPEATLPGAPPPPERKSGRGWLLAALVVLAVAAGVAYFLKDMLFGRPATRPEDLVAARPARPTPAPPTPVPTTTPPALATAAKQRPASKGADAKASAAPVSTAPAARPAGGSSGRTKGALIISKEWAGKPPIWVIHFSSHKDRPGAEREAARLGTALGKTGRAIEVDLGEKGIWYRVLIGDFATQDEARAYHTELEVRNTPNLGFVYQLKGEE